MFRVHVALPQHPAVRLPAPVPFGPGDGLLEVELLARTARFGSGRGAHATSPRLGAFSRAVLAASRSAGVASRVCSGDTSHSVPPLGDRSVRGKAVLTVP